MTWPGWTERLVDLQLWGVEYSLARLVMLALGVAVGVGALALAVPHEDRDGHPGRRRRPADDLGARDQHPEDVRDRLRRRRGARGGRRRRRRLAGAASRRGRTRQWLLNSLVVVIIGGMGSLIGAAAGSLLYAGVLTFSASYLPLAGDDCCTQYSIVAHVRPDRLRPRVPAAGPLRESRMSRLRELRRRRSSSASSASPSLVLVAARPGDLQRLLGEHDPHPDVPLRDRRREPDLPLRLRRDDLARPDRADGHLRLHAREHGHAGRRRRRDEGAHARLGPDARARRSRSC